MGFVSNYDTLYSTALAILTAIITGGFVLIFVESGNRKNREADKGTDSQTCFLTAGKKSVIC